MEEFSFGTLSTDDLRLEQLKSQRRGLVHLNRIEPRDPIPGEPVQVFAQSASDIESLAIQYPVNPYRFLLNLRVILTSDKYYVATQQMESNPQTKKVTQSSSFKVRLNGTHSVGDI